MSRDLPKGPYTLWLDYGTYEGWTFYDFETIEEALNADKFSVSQWVIQRPARYEIKVIEDAE